MLPSVYPFLSDINKYAIVLFLAYFILQIFLVMHLHKDVKSYQLFIHISAISCNIYLSD